MTRSSPYGAMPGSFVPAEHAGPKSHFFQPPRTPSASSSIYLSRSTTSAVSEGFDRPVFTGRKRSRHDYSVESNATPVSMMADWSNGIDTIDSMARSESIDPGSPIPFVNTRYQLAGGLDTPTAAQSVEENEYSDVGYRKRLSGGEMSKAPENSQNPYFSRIPPSFTDANGRPRIQSSAPQRAGWSQVALEVVGGVVGKVWEFCKAGAFRGFSAGGGQAYKIPGSQPHTPMESNFRPYDIDQIATTFGGSRDRESTPIPGQFIEEDFMADYNERTTLESTPPRALKRLHISNDDGELSRNWIMVSSATKTKITTPQTKSRPAARYSMPTASSAGRRLTGNAANRPASRATNRRPLLSNSRPSAVSHAGSPGLNPTRPASFASPRSPGGSRIPMPMSNHPIKTLAGQNGHNVTDSPASIEAQKWAARRMKEDKETDESIRRFNAQLKAMIREGKEALGTKVEVDDMGELFMEEVVDEGFEEGDSIAGEKWRLR